MAEVRLSAHEAQDGDLPPVCITCGARATEIVDRKVSVERHQLFSVRVTSTTVALPVCRQHRRASWVYWKRPVAKEITETSITLKHVSPRFMRALEDYRDDRDAGEEIPVVRVGGDGEEIDRPRRRPRRRERADDLPGYDPPSAWPRVLLILIVLLFVVPLVCGGLLFVLFPFLTGMGARHGLP
jgi:hypothetical protein